MGELRKGIQMGLELLMAKATRKVNAKMPVLKMFDWVLAFFYLDIPTSALMNHFHKIFPAKNFKDLTLDIKALP
ncbi:MAG: hypothetical protein ACOYYS_10755 [Chloroflexota bacterium]